MTYGLRGIFGTGVVEQQMEHKWVVARIDVRRDKRPRSVVFVQRSIRRNGVETQRVRHGLAQLARDRDCGKYVTGIARRPARSRGLRWPRGACLIAERIEQLNAQERDPANRAHAASMKPIQRPRQGLPDSGGASCRRRRAVRRQQSGGPADPVRDCDRLTARGLRGEPRRERGLSRGLESIDQIAKLLQPVGWSRSDTAVERGGKHRACGRARNERPFRHAERYTGAGATQPGPDKKPSRTLTSGRTSARDHCSPPHASGLRAGNRSL